MKVSHNNSRTQGSASHNDRTFDVWKADHIDLSCCTEYTVEAAGPTPSPGKSWRC